MKKRTFLKFALILLLSLSLGLLITACNDKPSTYSVEFITNGGSAVDKLEGATEIAASPETARPGYTFGGWYAAEDLSGEAVTFPLKLTADAKLYAKWTANVYTITFDYGEAQTDIGEDEKDVTFDAAIGELPSPGRAGYTFAGWYAGETAYTADTVYTLADDVTLTIKWAAQSYLLKFDYVLPTWVTEEDLTPGAESKEVVYLSAVGELPQPSLIGYNFAGWYDGDVEVTPETIFEKLSDWTVTSRWEKQTFTLTFDANGGAYGENPVLESTYEYKDIISTVSAPKRPGYSFRGWCETAACDGEVFSLNHYTVTENKTFYAKWDIINYTIKFVHKILRPGWHYETIDPMAPEQTGTIGDTITLPAIPQKTGYTVENWKFNNSNNTTWRYPASETQLTIDAAFVAGEYTDSGRKTISIIPDYLPVETAITLDANGGTLPAGTEPALTIVYDTSLSLPTPTLESRTFDGWYIADESGALTDTRIQAGTWQRTEPTLTLKAKWVGQPQTLTFDYAGATSGNTETTRTVNAEAALGTLPVPVKTGHTFSGWFAGDTEYTAASIMPDSALMLTAKWTVNTYTITYDLGGGELPAGAATTKTATYGQAIGELPTPTKTDAVFEGWTVAASTTVITAETLYTWGTDQVFYANWSDDIYTKGINYVFVPAAGDVPAYYKVGGGTSSPAYEGDALQEVVIAPTYNDGTNGEHPVKAIDNWAFRSKTALKTVDIPNSITLIGSLAFSNSGLTSVFIPASVETIKANAFGLCNNLVSAVYAPDCKANDRYVMSAFTRCSALKELTLPNGLTTFAMPSGVSLDKIVIPNGIEYKSDADGTYVYSGTTLYWCGGAEFTVPENITGFTSDAFKYSKIETLHFNSTADFGQISALTYNVASLKAITVPADHPSYVAIDGVLYSKNADGTTLTMLLYPAGKTDLEFATPENCNTIGQYAFINTHLKKLTLTAVNNFSQSNAIYTCNPELEIYVDYAPASADELQELSQSYFSTSVKAIYVHNVDIFKAKTGWSSLADKLFEYPAQP